MKLFIFYIFIFYIFIFCIFINTIVAKRLTSITTKKLCKDCKFFVGNTQECAAFGDVNMVTGKKKLESAIDMRKNKDECGYVLGLYTFTKVKVYNYEH
jgi:hypothetical protein